MTRKTARTARKVHHCGDCGRAIAIGERYWYHVASPDHDGMGNTRWWRFPECNDCASRYGRPVPELVAS